MKILVVGKGASGKDSLGEVLKSRGMKKCVFNTTRPIRRGEIDGVDYHFSEPDGKVMVGDSYNDWKYALTLENWEAGDFALFTPSYLKQLTQEIREQCFVIYIDVPESVRRARLQTRNDADQVDRRILADENDFAAFSDFDWKVSEAQLQEYAEDFNPLAQILFDRALELIDSSHTVDEISGILDKEWDQDRKPLPNETRESYVVSRLHLKLGSVLTINENGKFLFVYIDGTTRKLSTVGNLSTSVAADSLFDELTKSMFRKVRETQLGIAESVTLIQSIKSHAFKLPKEVRDNINGFLGKFNKQQ
jgi:guanylate kinase